MERMFEKMIDRLLVSTSNGEPLELELREQFFLLALIGDYECILDSIKKSK